MDYVRVIKNSEEIAKIIDIPKELRNRKVEIIILPYDNADASNKPKAKNMRGVFEKYKNETLQKSENEIWSKAMVEKHENS